MARITSTCEEKKGNVMTVKELLQQAQFHGLNKLDDAKYRWVWIMSLFLLLTAAFNVAGGIISRFLEQPTYIVRMEEGRTFVEFPSVQVCPQVAFPDYKVNHFLSKLKYPENLNESYVKSVIQQLGTFYSPDVQYTVQDLSRIQFLLKFNNIDVYTAGKTLTVSCEEALLRCRLFGQMKNCSELFKMELSQYGYCCVFNARSLRREILEYGIHKSTPRAEYFTPFMGFGSSLVIAVNQSLLPVDIDLDYKWIIVDGGHAYIDASLNGTPLSPGTEMWLGHKNQGFHIDQTAVSLDPELRGCKLSNEGLKLFPVYHKKYCQLECEIRYLLQRCKCVLLAHPVPPSIPSCRARSLPCARHSLARFNKGACPCYHTCDVATDIVEISSFRLIHHSALLDTFYHGLNFRKISVVRVFETKRDVKTKSRRSYYSYEDLFAQLGGIFNVFFGCSLLSILEIIQLIKYAFKNCRDRKKQVNKNTLKQTNKTKEIENQDVTFKSVIMKRRKQRKKVNFR